MITICLIYRLQVTIFQIVNEGWYLAGITITGNKITNITYKGEDYSI